MEPADKRSVWRLPGYLAFWTAQTVSAFGSYITTMALQVLVVLTLQGSATDVGILNASRWLPYLLFGLVVGAYVDRWRRRPLLVATDIGRAVLLGGIPCLWLMGWLNLPILFLFVALFGVLNLLGDAAAQSFLPRLVPQADLLTANARLDQGASVAQTTGPLLAGALVTAIGAPIAVLVDAFSYLSSAALISRIAVREPRSARGGPFPNLRREIGEGLRWVYRHRTLAPFAVSTHGWFVFNSMLGAIFVPFVLLQLRLTAFELGIALAAGGVGGFLGSAIATTLGIRLGAGRAIIVGRALSPIAWAVIACIPDEPRWIVVTLLAIGQALAGFAIGAENANEMAYRQSVTPDDLQARMNTTMRSVNRAMIVAGAPLGGLLADSIGYRPTIWIAVAGFVAVTVALVASPFRRARHDERA
jgi:MFS family permease